MSIKLSKMHQKVIDKKNLAKGISNNVFWDEAESHYQNCMNAIHQVEGQLVDVLSDLTQHQEKLALVQDQQALANNINILNKDVQEHIQRLNTIHAKHQDRSGGTCSPDEHMLLLQIHGEYAEALDIYQANILPTISFILEQIGAAEALIKAAQEEVQPTKEEIPVITDVVVEDAPRFAHYKSGGGVSDAELIDKEA